MPQHWLLNIYFFILFFFSHKYFEVPSVEATIFSWKLFSEQARPIVCFEGVNVKGTNLRRSRAGVEAGIHTAGEGVTVAVGRVACGQGDIRMPPTS